MTDKKKLVVVGNGMAGARVVEEILARGGGDKFAITMFGDEPYGNYNRILLSDVLNGSHDASEIFLNPLSWYQEHGIRLHAGVRAQKILRMARRVVGSGGVVEDYDVLILATGSLPFLPKIEHMRGADGQLLPGVFAFRSLDDCNRITEFALGKRRAVVIGGGLLGLAGALAVARDRRSAPSLTSLALASAGALGMLVETYAEAGDRVRAQEAQREVDRHAERLHS